MSTEASRAGHGYATQDIHAYVDRVHATHDTALAQAFVPPPEVPSIMVAPAEGKLLQVLASLVAPTRIVEIGTLVGYSTIHLARALREHGHLWTCEFSPLHAGIARENIAHAGLSESVTVLQGPALETLPTLEAHGPFDVVFIDADKDNYAAYGKWALAHLRKGGLLIADNTYLFGELLNDDARGRSMRELHERVAATCDSASISTPDGMILGIKR